MQNSAHCVSLGMVRYRLALAEAINNESLRLAACAEGLLEQANRLDELAMDVERAALNGERPRIRIRVDGTLAI